MKVILIDLFIYCNNSNHEKWITLQLLSSSVLLTRFAPIIRINIIISILVLNDMQFNRLIIGDNWRWFLLCWITSSYFNLFLPYFDILSSFHIIGSYWVRSIFILFYFSSFFGKYFLDRTIFWCMNRRLFKVQYEFVFFFFLLFSACLNIFVIITTDQNLADNEDW